MTVPDYPDWQTSQKRALEIYNQTVPLGRKPSGVGTASTVLAGGGSTNIVNGQTVGQPSVQMLIGLSYADATPTIPFGRLKFQWTDTASGFTVDPDWCTLVGGVISPNFYYIASPSRADVLTIELDNLDPAKTLFYSFGISQISHVYDDIRLEQVGRVTPPVFTLPSSNNQQGILASFNASIGISAQADRLASAWSGKAILSVNNKAGSATVTAELLDPGVVAGGAPLVGASGIGIIASVDAGTGSPQTQEVAIPNTNVVLRVINQSGMAAQTPMVTLTRSR